MSNKSRESNERVELKLELVEFKLELKPELRYFKLGFFIIYQSRIMYIYFFLLTECCGKASLLYAELDRNVHIQHIRGGVGSDSRIRVRRMGEYNELHQANRHIWTLRQVLSMSCTKTLNATCHQPTWIPNHDNSYQQLKTPSSLLSSSSSKSSCFLVCVSSV